MENWALFREVKKSGWKCFFFPREKYRTSALK
jgi:hypothetical protein